MLGGFERLVNTDIETQETLQALARRVFYYPKKGKKEVDRH